MLIKLSSNQAIKQSSNQASNQSINQSINQASKKEINQSINQSINQYKERVITLARSFIEINLIYLGACPTTYGDADEFECATFSS